MRTLNSGIELDLRDITEFYDRFEVDPIVVTEDEETFDMRYHLGHLFTEYETSHTATVPGDNAFNGDDDVLLVHGWNMDDFWKKAFAETTVKRLYWQGYTGRVGTFNWPTLVDSLGPLPDVFPSALNQTYNASEYVAFRTAPALKSALEQLRDDVDGSLQVISHSMGNVVVGEALRIWSLSNPSTPLVDTYIAMQAAISAGAYGSNATDALGASFEEYDYYRHFPNFESAEPLDALFHGSRSAATNWINVYNPIDSALGLWEINNITKPDLASVSWPYEYTRTGEFPQTVTRVRSADRDDRQHLEFWDEEGPPEQIYTLGGDSYEILAFASVSRAKPLGRVDLGIESRWVSIEMDESLGYTADLPDYTGGANHSFEFHYDAQTTFIFWNMIKTFAQGAG